MLFTINHPQEAQEPAPIPVPTTFVVNRNSLEAPRYINAGAALEKKLPYAIFLKLEFLEKRGTHAFAYNTLNGAVDGVYLLANGRDDRYDALTVSLHHHLRGHYEIFPEPIRAQFPQQSDLRFRPGYSAAQPSAQGPFPWDTPNRFVGWGVLPGFNLPVIHKFDIVYKLGRAPGCLSTEPPIREK